MKKKKIDLSQFDEDRLRRILVNLLSDDFDIEAEVTGKFLVDGSQVRIDFLATPHQRLIDLGFIDHSIGIEVKSPASKSASPNKFAWQSVTYAQSEFNGIRPAFVLMFPDVTHFWDGLIAVKMRQFLEMANVGQLETGRYEHNWREWRMVFNNAYYSAKYGMGGVSNEAIKRRSGNC